MADLPLNDLSYAQPYMNWEVFAQHSDGALLRTGQGIYEDNLFRTHFENALKVNRMRGLWHFHQPNQMGTPQVNAFLAIYDSLSYKPKKNYLDIEDIRYPIYNPDGSVKEWVNVVPPSREFHTLAIMQWCEIYEARTGNILGFYTRQNYWDQWVIPSNTEFWYGGIKYKTPDWSRHSLWIASWYSYVPGLEPRLPRDWIGAEREYDLHQYQGGDGRTEGVLASPYGGLGPVDQNRFNGTHEEMLAFFDGKEIPQTMAAIYNKNVAQENRARLIQVDALSKTADNVAISKDVSAVLKAT